MRRERKIPSILKPTIDEEIALEFASTGSIPASGSAIDKSADAPLKQNAPTKKSDNDVGKDMMRISIIIKKSLYERIAKDAARKARTVDEHLKKHLAKHYGK